MKKRVLSLAVVMAFSIVSIFGCFNAFASESKEDTNVKISSGSKAAKTVIVDDDFEDRTVDAATLSGSTYTAPLDTTFADVVICQETDGNKYVSNGGTNWLTYVVKNSSDSKYYIESDRLAFSLDVMNPEALKETHAENYSSAIQTNIYIQNTAVFALLINEKSTAQGLEMKYFYKNSSGNLSSADFKNSSGSTFWTTARSSDSPWNHVEFVFKRELQTDGTYTVALESLNVNGSEYYVGSAAFGDNTPTFTTVDWWSENSTRSNFIKIGNTQSVWCLDNVLIYEPSEYYVATNVAMQSYMAPVKNIYVDDDFNNRTLSSEISTASAYTSGTLAIGGWNSTESKSVYAVAEGTQADKYAATKYAYTSVKAKDTQAESIKTAESLVVSFDSKHYDNSAAGQIYVQFAGTTVLSFYASSLDNEYYNITCATAGGSVYQQNIGKKDTTWNKIYAVFTKEYDADTQTYYAYLDKLYVDGTASNPWNTASFVVPEKVPANALATNWWDVASGKQSVQLVMPITNICLDNILIYQPVEALELTSASLNGNTVTMVYDQNVDNTVLPTVTATDVSGNVANASVEVTGQNVVAVFNGANFANNVYAVSASGITDRIYGLAADNYSGVFGTGFESVNLTDATLKIRNGSSAALTGKLIVAAYDSSDNLVNAVVNATDISAPVDLSSTMQYTLPTGDGISYYKFFAWDDLTNLTPLFSQATIE